jgi:hypothetical protein
LRASRRFTLFRGRPGETGTYQEPQSAATATRQPVDRIETVRLVGQHPHALTARNWAGICGETVQTGRLVGVVLEIDVGRDLDPEGHGIGVCLSRRRTRPQPITFTACEHAEICGDSAQTTRFVGTVSEFDEKYTPQTFPQGRQTFVRRSTACKHAGICGNQPPLSHFVGVVLEFAISTRF